MKKMGMSLAVLASLASSAGTVNLADIESVNQRGLSPDQNNTSMQRIKAVRGASVFFEDFQDQVDPLNPLLPADWLLFNVDMLTPNPSVAFVTEAWTIRDDFITPAPDPNDPDIALFSTSWYSPVGTANDWVITPMISLPGAAELSWVANAPDPSYADGYEVYVSNTTQDIAGCQAGGTVFTTPGEDSVDTARSVSLSDAGFMNEDVYICFRNNSNDKYLLILDDVRVVETLENNVTLDAVATLPEYTQVPDKLLSYDIPLAVEFSNSGVLEQSNITVEAEILRNGISLTTISQVYAGPLVSGGSDSLDLGSYTATLVGVYDVVYTLTLDGVVDENPADNTATINAVTEITTDTMSRDDGEDSTTTLGIGNGTAGYLGNAYEFSESVTVDAIQFIHSNNSCDPGPACTLDGLTLSVDVFMINPNTGLPDMMVGSSEEYVVPTGAAVNTVVDLSFPGNLNLSAGSYVFALKEPEEGNAQLATTENRFTPGTGWVLFPIAPESTWQNNETFNFLVTYYMRPKFIETDLIFKNGFE